MTSEGGAVGDRSLLVTFAVLVATGAVAACAWTLAARFAPVALARPIRAGAHHGPATRHVRGPTPTRRPARGPIINGSGVPRPYGAPGADTWLARNRQVRRRDTVAGRGGRYLF